MFSQLAQVFSSQGVLIQGTKYASMPPSKRVKAAESEKQGEVFKGLFDQASVNLEISKPGNALHSRDMDVQTHENEHLAAKGGSAEGGSNVENELARGANPSKQDPAVAGSAAQMAMDAHMESQPGDAEQINGPVTRAYTRNPTVTGKSFAAYA